MMIGITDSELAQKMVRAIQPDLCDKDPHGYGLVLWDGSPRHAPKVRKWRNPEEAYTRWDIDPIQASGLLPWVHGKPEYHEAGPEQGPLRVILSHSRFATCAKTLRNVHPFQRRRDGWESTLVHNGVVDSLYEKLDTEGSDDCDSMGLLATYQAVGAPGDLAKASQIAERLGGWAAFGVITRRTGRGKGSEGFVDIGRSNAPLYVVQTHVGLIFTTVAEFGLKAARRCGVEVTGSWGLDDDQIIRFTPDGRVVARAEMSIPNRWQDYTSKRGFVMEDFYEGSGVRRGESYTGPAIVTPTKAPSSAIPTPDSPAGDAPYTVRKAPPGAWSKVGGEWSYRGEDSGGKSFVVEKLTDKDKSELEDLLQEVDPEDIPEIYRDLIDAAAMDKESA
jgi:hypothetical protein